MNQMELEFQLEKPEFPVEYDRLIISFFKASLQVYSPELLEQLYTKQASVIKPYCWACHLPGAKFSGEKILLREKRFKVYFSDADLVQNIYFFNAFTMMKGKEYPVKGSNRMWLRAVRFRRQLEIEDSEIIVKMQSTLLARRHDAGNNTDTYYTCEDPEFSEVVKENIGTMLQKQNLMYQLDDFQIIPIKAKKVVVKVFGRPTNASIGIFKLIGSVELLNYLYSAGTGVRRSEGHGKLVIIG